MPTYEYLCKNCGDRFEKVQSFTARPLKTHDACGGEVQKVFHASGVVFKGPGFYATDNRSSNGSASRTTVNGSSTSESSSDSSTTTKSAPAAAAADD